MSEEHREHGSWCPKMKLKWLCKGEGSCEWWVSEEQKCSEVVKALALRNIARTLDVIHTDYFGAKEKS